MLKFWVQHVTRVMVSNAAVTRRSWKPVAEMLATCLAKLPPWYNRAKDPPELDLCIFSTAVSQQHDPHVAGWSSIIVHSIQTSAFTIHGKDIYTALIRPLSRAYNGHFDQEVC